MKCQGPLQDWVRLLNEESKEIHVTGPESVLSKNYPWEARRIIPRTWL